MCFGLEMGLLSLMCRFQVLLHKFRNYISGALVKSYKKYLKFYKFLEGNFVCKD